MNVGADNIMLKIHIMMSKILAFFREFRRRRGRTMATYLSFIYTNNNQKQKNSKGVRKKINIIYLFCFFFFQGHENKNRTK